MTKLEAALGELGPEAIIELLGTAGSRGQSRTGRDEGGRSLSGRGRTGQPLGGHRASQYSRRAPVGRAAAQPPHGASRGQARARTHARRRRHDDWSSSEGSPRSGSAGPSSDASRVGSESSGSSRSGSDSDSGSDSSGSGSLSSRGGGGVRRSTGPGASRDKRAAERRLAEARALAERAERANPTGDAVADMALWLGLDPAGEADEAAMWVAEEALTAPLPQGWETATVPLPAAPPAARRGPHVGAGRAGPQAPGSVAYFYRVDDDGQAIAGSSQWEHPLDGYYRALARRAKEELGPAMQASAAAPRSAQPPQPPRQPGTSAVARPPVLPPVLPGAPAQAAEGSPTAPPPPMLGGGLRHSPPRASVVPRDYDPGAIDRLSAGAAASGRAGPRRSVLSRVASAAGAAVSAASAAVTSFVAPPRAQGGAAASRGGASLPSTAGNRPARGAAGGAASGAAPPSTPPRGRAGPPAGGSPSRVAPAQPGICLDDSPQRPAASRGSPVRAAGPSAAGGTATRIEVKPGSRSLDRPPDPSPDTSSAAATTTIVPAGAGGAPVSDRLATLLRLPACIDPLLGGVSRSGDAPSLRAGLADQPEPLPSPRPSWRLVAALERSSAAASPPRAPVPATLPRFLRNRRCRASSVEMDPSASATDVVARLRVPSSEAFSSRAGPDPRRAPVTAEEISEMCLHLELCPASLARAGALWLVRAAVLAVPPPAWAVVSQEEASTGGAVFAHRGTTDVVGLHPVDSLLLPLLRAAEASGRPPLHGASRAPGERGREQSGLAGAWAVCPEGCVSSGGFVAAKGHAGVLHSCVGSQLVLAPAPAAPQPIAWELVPARGRWPRALLQGGGPAAPRQPLSVDVSALGPPSKLPALSAPAARSRLHSGFGFGPGEANPARVPASRRRAPPASSAAGRPASGGHAAAGSPAPAAGPLAPAGELHTQSAPAPPQILDSSVRPVPAGEVSGAAQPAGTPPGTPGADAPLAPRGVPPASRRPGAASAWQPRGPPPRGPPPRGPPPRGPPPRGPRPAGAPTGLRPFGPPAAEPRALAPPATAPAESRVSADGAVDPAHSGTPCPAGAPGKDPPGPPQAAPAPAEPAQAPAGPPLQAAPVAPASPLEPRDPPHTLPAIAEAVGTSSSSSTPTADTSSGADRSPGIDTQPSPSGSSAPQPAPDVATQAAGSSPPPASQRAPPRQGSAEQGAADPALARNHAERGGGQQCSEAKFDRAGAGMALQVPVRRAGADAEPGRNAIGTRHACGRTSSPAAATALAEEEADKPDAAAAPATAAPASAARRVGDLVPVVLVSRGVPRQAVACGATLERPVPAADPDAWIEGACSPEEAALCRAAVLRRYAQAVGIVAPARGGLPGTPARRVGGLPPPPAPPAGARRRADAAAASAPPRPPPTSARASAPAGELWPREALEALSLGDLGALERVLSTLVQWQSQALVAATARRDEAQESAHDAGLRARQVLAAHHSQQG